MKASKIPLLVALSVLLTSAVAASSFGTFTSETDVTVSGNQASFTITMMNTGDEPLSIYMEPRNADSSSVRFSNNSFILKASGTTKNPSNEGSWYYLGNGEYVKTRTIDMTVFLQDSSSESFDVDIKARPVGGPTQGVDSEQDIVQVRTYSYSVTSQGFSPNNQGEQQGEVGFDFGGGNSGLGLPGIDLGGSQNNPPSEQRDGETDVVINESEDSSGDDSRDQETIFNESGETQENGITGESTNSPTGGFFQSQNINGVTVILMIGVMASAAYLYKVM